MRRLTRYKLDMLKILMLRGCTIREALKALHMGGSTYTRYAKDYIWGDEKFVRQLFLVYEFNAPIEFTPANPEKVKKNVERLKKLILGY